MKKVAILGATGYIGKSLAYEFSLNPADYRMFLFSRSKEKLHTIVDLLKHKDTISLHNLDEFTMFDYDVIINCTGSSDSSVIQKDPQNILTITKEIDEKIISYLRKNEQALYINMSSGAVHDYPSDGVSLDEQVSMLSSNNLSARDYYAIAKINSEKYHRSLGFLRIVDVRIFSFFSRFVDTHSHFLMSEIAQCLKDKKVFQTNSQDIIRDYISPYDLFSFLRILITKNHGNDFFDIYSASPVSKLKLLEILKQNSNLKFTLHEVIQEDTGLSKKIYYPENKKAHDIGYVPR